jgi:DNA-binding MarR family transcriptional regulator
MYEVTYSIPRPLRNNVAFLLRVASEAATEILDRELAALGIHSRHAAILALAAEHSLNQSAIAAATQTHPNAVIALIDTLEEKELAVREQNPSNRREYLVRVTGAGRKVVRQMEKAMTASAEKLTENLSPEEKIDFSRLLLKAIEGWEG